MSYEKAMRHAANVRKCRKQARNYMGFDAGSGSWPNPRKNPLRAREIEVGEWFKERHRGDKQYLRECIREAIADVRTMRQKMPAAA